MLTGADEALLCSAFVAEAGVHLLTPQLRALSGRVRLLATTVFGSTSPAALNLAADLGTDVRVFNERRGTYHPKMYLARREDRAIALIGSANLTGGLVVNVEAGALLEGSAKTNALANAWKLGEQLWADPAAEPWQRSPNAPPTCFRPELLRSLIAVVPEDGIIETLGSTPKPNTIVEVAPHGIYVETEKSRRTGSGPQLVPAWMIELAYDYLVEHGELSNMYLLADDGLNVKRSSFVCALLSRLPNVGRRPGRTIVLEKRPTPRYQPLPAGTESRAADGPPDD